MKAKELPFQEIEALLESIISNKRLVKLEFTGGTEFVVLSHPTSQQLLVSRYVREKAAIFAKEEGLPTLEEAEANLDKITSQEEKDELNKLQEQLEGQEKVLKITEIEARKSSVRENIERIEGEIQKFQIKPMSHLYMSQERKADEESFLYLAWSSTYDVTGDQFWDSFESFEEDKQYNQRSAFLEEFTSFNVGLPSETIRFLARHSLWRIRYTAAMKTGQQLFERGLVDLTPDQLSLLYWSNYYQSIFEMMPDDQPSPEIIEDDEKLDAYMDSYFKQREEDRKETTAGSRSGSRGSKLNAWEKGEELIITPSHPDYMELAYTKERVKSAEGTSEIEVISPNSRRAKNRRAARKEALRGPSGR